MRIEVTRCSDCPGWGDTIDGSSVCSLDGDIEGLEMSGDAPPNNCPLRKGAAVITLKEPMKQLDFAKPIIHEDGTQIIPFKP